MTYLQLVNAVLRKLREDEVTSVSDNDYSALIGDFVNLIKEEVEDSTNWEILRSTVQVTVTEDTYSYALTGTSTRSRILNVFNDTENWWMYPKSSKYLTSVLNGDNVESDSPMYYGINGVDANGALKVDVYPVPDNSTDVLNFNMIIEEDTLSDDTDTTAFPDRVLIYGAWALAISERGEDGGALHTEVEGKYQQALADAIAIDGGNHEFELIMETV